MTHEPMVAGLNDIDSIPPDPAVTLAKDKPCARVERSWIANNPATTVAAAPSATADTVIARTYPLLKFICSLAQRPASRPVLILPAAT